MESTPVLAPRSVSPTSLAAAFAAVPDPRRAASVVSPLAAMLTLAVAALLADHRSVLAIAAWGARQEADLLAALGFPHGRTPCQSTVQRLFRPLDGDAWAAALSAWFAPGAARRRRSRSPRAGPSTAKRSADGCALRGRTSRSSMP